MKKVVLIMSCIMAMPTVYAQQDESMSYHYNSLYEQACFYGKHSLGVASGVLFLIAGIGINKNTDNEEWQRLLGLVIATLGAATTAVNGAPLVAPTKFGEYKAQDLQEAHELGQEAAQKGEPTPDRYSIANKVLEQRGKL